MKDKRIRRVQIEFPEFFVIDGLPDAGKMAATYDQDIKIFKVRKK